VRRLHSMMVLRGKDSPNRSTTLATRRMSGNLDLEITLNYGLRYEYYTPLREDRNLQVLFDINTGHLRDPHEAASRPRRIVLPASWALTLVPKSFGTGYFSGGRTVLRGGFRDLLWSRSTEEPDSANESGQSKCKLYDQPHLSRWAASCVPT